MGAYHVSFFFFFGLPSSALKLFAPNKCHFFFFSACGWKKLQFFSFFCVCVDSHLLYFSCDVQRSSLKRTGSTRVSHFLFFFFAIAQCLVYNTKKKGKKSKKKKKGGEKRQTMSHRIALNE